MNRIPQIDFYRGAAALAVFISHFFAWARWDNRVYLFAKSAYEKALKIFQMSGEGHPGVVCFIVLSGFCIHMVYSNKELHQLNISKEIRKFYLRRFFRIYPLFAIATIIGICAVLYIEHTNAATKQDLQLFSASTIKHVSASNIAQKMLIVSGIFPPTYDYTYLGNAPLASVVTEMWLYICYPLFFYLLRKKGWATIFILTTVLYLLLPIVWNIVGQEVYYSWWLFSLCNYYVLWALGAFAAEVVFGKIKLAQGHVLKMLAVAGIVYFGLFILSRVVPNSNIKLLRMLMLGLAFAALLITTIKGWTSPSYRFYAILKSYLLKPIASLGDISYSLYAIHAPIVMILLTFISAYGLAQMSILAIPLIILILSVLTYKVIEQPTHKWAKNFTNKK
jgi:peptidoglycan/LPS O-acetylase OafA/YrhL